LMADGSMGLAHPGDCMVIHNIQNCLIIIGTYSVAIFSY
jgi:hypothetical protein